jgi:phage baseplate assembly protein W
MALSTQISRLGVNVNLVAGDTYDILVVATPEGYPTGGVKFVFDKTPRKISGIQKVAQTFLRILFTTKGSDVYHPNFGTVFPDITIGANIRYNSIEFNTLVEDAVGDASVQTRYILNSVTSAKDSMLDSATLMGFNFGIDYLDLYVVIRTLAGETASIAIPFPQLDMLLSNN